MKKQWCIPEVGAEFVWRMEDVLDLYEEPYDPNKPLICFDEMPYQMVAEKRTPFPTKPDQPARYDYEYERRGVRNLFVFFEPKASWRHVDLRERRTARDFAQQMKRLADDHYPEAEKIRVVLDNLRAPIPRLRSTRHSSQSKPGASCASWSFITRPSTPPGSTRWRSS